MKFDAQDFLQQIIAARSANSKNEDLKALIRRLEIQARDMLEEDTGNDYSGIDQLKGML